MKLAIIDKKDVVLKLDGHTIKFEEQTIPFKLIDTLILNHRATLNSGDILKLTKENINILIISLFQNNLLQIDDFSKKGGVYLKYDGRKKIWKEFVALVDILKPKLDNEIANIRRWINE